MTDQERVTHEAAELRHMLRRVRRRWRLRMVLQALALVFGLGLVAVVLTALLTGLFGGEENLLATLRWPVLLAVTAAAAAALARAVLRRATDEQLALYVEDHQPELGQTLVTAMEESARPTPTETSPALVARLAAAARRALESLERGDRVERPRLRRSSGALASVTIGAAALFLLGPASLRDAARAIFLPWHPIRNVVTRLGISVTPGNAEVPKGGALEIQATLHGFASELAELVFRADSGAEWQRIPMERDATAAAFGSRLFDLVQPTAYFVEAQGIRSPTYRLTVSDLPTVRTITVEVRPPVYTGLPNETIENAGDLAVLTGSTVVVRATPTRPVKAGWLILEGIAPIAMRVVSDSVLAGAVRVSVDGFYRIELQSEDGRRVRGSLQYAIDALEDRPPTVTLVAPGRDTKVTTVEEVTTRASASDDFGVRKLELFHTVNGGAEQRVGLADTTLRRLTELEAAHTFFLEEMGLQPGDVVSYYARAADGLGQTASSDIYFLEIRPFSKTYRQAEQSGMPGGGGESAEGLSERQRQIVAGTFNVLRDSAATRDDEWRENVTTLAIAQGRLREEVAALSGRLSQRRLASADSAFALIKQELDLAHREMLPAEEGLGRQRPREALPPEQRALQHLMRAEAAYREVQVSLGNAGGSGGGGASRAEELADLFELETDKLRNQYESVQRERQAEADRRLDETLERLRRLASRQQQENERMERLADALRNRAGQTSGSGGGGNQRQLAQEAEEAARQLERLAREQSAPELAEAARRMREAAEAMRRAASGSEQSGAVQGSNALQRLRDATRRLEQSRSGQTQAEVQRLLARAQTLGQRQQEVAQEASGLPAPGVERSERATALGEKKDAMATEAERLLADLERLSRDARREQPKSAAKLGEAAETMKNSRIRDKLLFSKGLLRSASPEYLRSFEEQIGQNLGAVTERIRDAVAALDQPRDQREARALDRTRELVRGLESLSERARARARAGGPQGQQSDPNQQGQQGPQGQTGGQQSDRRGQSSGAVVQGTPRGQPTGRLDPGDIRQFTRELRSRRDVADSLRRDLIALEQDVAELDRVIAGLRDFENPRTLGDPRGLDRLEAELIEQLKNFEFTLWRKLDAGNAQRPVVGSSSRVPPEYRALVEEYYRSLARKRP